MPVPFIYRLFYNKRMNERLYKFTMADGSIEFLSIADAQKKNVPDFEGRLNEIMLNSKNKRMNKDGFEPGWQENIQAYAGGRKEYDRLLKEKGLVEIGYDYIPADSTTTTGAKGMDFALHAKEIGIDLNDQEIDAIADGSYFDSSKCDLTE